MMRHILFMTVAIVSGCVGAIDPIYTIYGNLHDENGESYKDCIVSIYDANSNKYLGDSVMYPNQKLMVSFGRVVVGSKDVYLEFKCDYSNNLFRTPVFDISGGEKDLGQMMLERN